MRIAALNINISMYKMYKACKYSSRRINREYYYYYVHIKTANMYIKNIKLFKFVRRETF